MPVSARGFSLVETAIVLALLGLLLGGLLLPVAQSVEQTRRHEAQRQLLEIREALLGFAAAHGRLPCPALPNATPLGQEQPAGGGVCSSANGFVPSLTLGLAGATNGDGLLLDPWSQPLRFAVTTANGGAFTTADRVRLIGMAALAPDLTVCSDLACTVHATTTAPAVIYATGLSGNALASAAETQNGEALTAPGLVTGARYRVSGDGVFIALDYSAAGGARFDDMVDWLAPPLLYATMIAAGQLP